MTEPIDTCPIWGSEFEAKRFHFPQTDTIRVEDSPRAGGGYDIDQVLIPSQVHDLSDQEKARLTSWLVDQRIQGNSKPLVTRDIIAIARNQRLLPVYEKAERLLKFIISNLTALVETVDLAPAPNSSPNQAYLSALAWSELTKPPNSTEARELLYLMDYLKERGWIVEYPVGNRYSCRVTVECHRQTAEQETNIDSSQAFVAMWFDPRMNDAYEQGIKLGIKDAGYKPLRIDREPDVNKIDDEIIAGIRKSRFLVADFTQGDDGARGGVYFEAGFALGLDLRVIYTCRRDMVDKLAFDTRQYNHILWDTPKDLRLNLKNRIEAWIGRGAETP